MPDDTAATLSDILDVPPWEVVETVQRLAAEHATLTADLAAALDPERDRKARIALAVELAPTAGRYRTAILAALRRGKEWGDIDEANYYDLIDRPCVTCGGYVGDGIGLDRQDATRGYYLDNVEPSCGPCNVARHRTVGGRRDPRPHPAPDTPI